MSFRLHTTRMRSLGAALGLLTVAGCSSAVTSERNAAIAIPSGATVSFRGSASDGSARVDPAVENDSIHHMIQRAIVAQLQQKGYTVVDTSQSSNFTVRYYLEVASTTGVAQTAGGVSGPKVGGYKGYGYGYGWNSQEELADMKTETLKQASFGVDLVDEQAGRTAWRGMWAREPKNKAPDQARVNQVVGEVMKSLPTVP